jgi:hypothetical protein
MPRHTHAAFFALLSYASPRKVLNAWQLRFSFVWIWLQVNLIWDSNDEGAGFDMLWYILFIYSIDTWYYSFFFTSFRSLLLKICFSIGLDIWFIRINVCGTWIGIFFGELLCAISGVYDGEHVIILRGMQKKKKKTWWLMIVWHYSLFFFWYR